MDPSVVENLSVKQAQRIFKNAAVRKEFAEGWFEGSIVKVERGVLEKRDDGEFLNPGLMFLVRYDDGDEEDLEAASMLEILVDPAGVHSRFVALQENRTDKQPAKRARAQPAQDDTDHENLNSAGGAGGGGSNAGRGRARPASRANATDPTPGYGEGPLLHSSTSEAPIPYRPEDGARSVGLPGHLKTIELIDFMCHHHMSMDFNPHVTFVSGSNGSGKSATLQALQCCLGVRAKLTGRSAQQKNFIRTGAQEATVRVTLWNKPYAGAEAFQHELYGDFITVERRIAHGAGSGWALKDSRGRVVARKREDLDAMLSTMGINAANPVTVMSQDTARTFLAGSTAKADTEKFDLYMESTQLGAIAESMIESEQVLNQMNESVEKITEKRQEMEARRDGVQKKVDMLQGVQGWRKETDDLEKVLAWVLVETEEKAIEELRDDIGENPNAESAATNELAALRTEVQSLGEAINQKRSFLENFEQNCDKLGAAEKAAKAELKESKKKVAAQKRAIEKLQDKVTEQLAAKVTLEKAVTDVADEMTAGTLAAHAEYTSQLEAANAELRTAHSKIDRAMADKGDAEVAERAAGDSVREKGNAVRALGEQVRALENDLRNMSGAEAKNKAFKFGAHPMVKLVSDVAAAAARGVFHKPPIGPVGQYVELQDPRWGRAVEAALGLSLHTFLAHDQHDWRELDRLVRAANFGPAMRPTICVVRLDLPQHRIPAGRQPDESIPTVLRQIAISDAAVAAPVFNFLVDQQRAEKTALAASYEDGKRMALASNVAVVYEADGSKRYRRGMTETHEPPPFWMQQGRPLRLGGTTREAVNQTKAALTAAKRSVAEAQAALKAAHAEEVAAIEATKRARLALTELRRHGLSSRSAVETLQSQMPAELAATQSGAGEDDDITNEIYQTARAIDRLQDQLETAKSELVSAEASEAAAAQRLKDVKDDLKRLQEENLEFVASYETELKKESEVKARLAQREVERAECAAKHAEAVKALRDKEAEVVAAIETAEKMCKREEAAQARTDVAARLVAQGRVREDKLSSYFTKNVLLSKLKGLEKKIEEAERDAGGTLFDLEKALNAAEKELAGEGSRLKTVMELYQQLLRSFRCRQKKFLEVQRLVEANVNMKFNSYMNRKGHMGRIKVNREDRKLTLTVQIGKERGVKDLKQLSGGERSYTTVAFTLALGCTTEMPFRAMDEFDVFMDSVNRRMAMENLLMFAREQAELQFVFLTPQDMAAVDEAKRGCARSKCPIPDDFVKIVAMKPARANAAQA